MNITFKELVKYAKMKNVNGSNIKEILKHKDLVYKIEELREKDANLNEVVERLQKCNFSKRELKEIEEIYENYFGLDAKETEEEIIAEKFGVSLDKVETLKLEDGEVVYRVVTSDNKDIVLKEEKDAHSFEDELNNLSDSVEFDSNYESNTEDAFEYQRLNGFNELDFYTKEEINRKPELLDNLTIKQVEEIRVLIKMDNVVFINPKYGLGLGANHQLIDANYNSFKGTVSVVDSSRENKDTVDDIEVLDLYTENKRVANEDEYADLVSTTELPVIDDKMLEEYDNSKEQVEELGNQKVLKRNNKKESVGFARLAILLIIALIGVVLTIIKFIL